MPEVLNRTTKERKVKAALKKCRDDQRRDLLTMLGDPPDFSNIPDSFWDQAAECEKDALIPVLLPIFILQSKKARKELGLSILDEEIFADANKFIGQRAESFGKKAVGHTRKRLKNKLRSKERREIFTPESVDPIFNEGRIEGAAITEVTEASSKADERAAKGTGLKEGIDFVRIWIMNPACRHCVFCPKVHRTDFSYWGRFCKTGPPAHPRCCCHLDLFKGSIKEARVSGALKPVYPSVGTTQGAANEVGITC